MPSPVVPLPGVGQVGEGLQNSWGLEEVDDDMEENDNSAEEHEEEVAKMEEVYKDTVNRAGCKTFFFSCFEIRIWCEQLFFLSYFKLFHI